MMMRKLSRFFLNSSEETPQQNVLAVIWAMEKLRPYLGGIKFIVITDGGHSLLWSDRLKVPTDKIGSLGC